MNPKKELLRSLWVKNQFRIQDVENCIVNPKPPNPDL